VQQKSSDAKTDEWAQEVVEGECGGGSQEELGETGRTHWNLCLGGRVRRGGGR